MINIGTGHGPADNGGLVRVQVNKTHLNKHTKESTWAKALGDDLYEIRGPLHLISNINSHDIVKAVLIPGDSLPSVLEVVKRSGFRTLHLVFFEGVPISDQKTILEEMTQWNTTFDTPFERFYTVEMNPDGNYSALCSYLKSLRVKQLLMHEPEVDLDALLRFRFLGKKPDSQSW